MIAVQAAGYTVVEAEGADGVVSFRTDGLGRALHPEIAVSGLTLEAAEAFLGAVVDRVLQGDYLDLPGGRWAWQGMSWNYQWKPEQFVFWFAESSHPQM
jgi:hypothetical protein